MKRRFSLNWQITVFLVVGGLYRFSRQNGAVLGASVRGSVCSGWVVGLVQKLLKWREVMSILNRKLRGVL
jgi:hypothetical protein